MVVLLCRLEAFSVSKFSVLSNSSLALKIIVSVLYPPSFDIACQPEDVFFRSQYRKVLRWAIPLDIF
jgi:hypothetical protein